MDRNARGQLCRGKQPRLESLAELRSVDSRAVARTVSDELGHSSGSTDLFPDPATVGAVCSVCALGTLWTASAEILVCGLIELSSSVIMASLETGDCKVPGTRRLESLRHVFA